MRGRLRAVAGIALGGAILALAACAFAPEPADARASASAVFDDLVAELSAAEPTLVRAVEILSLEPRKCADAGLVQEGFAARGSLSVQAEDATASETLNTLASSLGEGWSPVPTASEGDQRAWTSDDGVVVILTNGDPVLTITVFPPCAPPR